MSPRPVVASEKASDSTLRKRECAWCGQSLLQAKRGHCGEVFGEGRGPLQCHWVRILHKPEAPR